MTSTGWKNVTFATIAWVVTVQEAAAAAPKLVVAISVDQLSADLYTEYRPLFTKGLRKLSGGSIFPSGFQSHAATETCPGHSTLLTGAHPSRTGIIANEWFDFSARADAPVYCAEDPSKPKPELVGGRKGDYFVTADTLKVPTLGDRMKAAFPGARSVAVSGKDRGAVMMGGHTTDAIWYWDREVFTTLPGRTEVPAAVNAANARVASLIGAAVTPAVPAVCAARQGAVKAGPVEVGLPATRAAGDYKSFRASPQLDEVTTTLAIDLLRELRLGSGPATDVLAVSLSATDYVGHRFGTEGVEMCTQLLSLDAQLGRLLDALDQTKVPYTVVLSADHGGHDLPERNVLRGAPDARRAAPRVSPDVIGSEVAQDLGLKAKKVLYSAGMSGDWYLSPEVPADQRSHALARAREKLLAEPDVAAVFTYDELYRTPPAGPPVDDWTLAQKARASFDPTRSGDLVVLTQPRVTAMPAPEKAGGYVATHGSPWNYDRRVPILFWWPGITPVEHALSAETVDILPTLAALVGLTVPPAEIDGRCLDLDPTTRDTCRP